MQLAIQVLLYSHSGEEIRRLFASVAALKIPQGLQVVLATADQGPEASIDESLQAELRAILDGFSWVHRRHDENHGFGGGHNRIADLHPGMDRLILNPDGVVPTNLLEKFYQAAEEFPDWGLMEARQVPLEMSKHVDFEELNSDHFSGACLLVKAEAWKRVGGFDELFFMYSEDIDFGWRIRASGFRTLSLPDAVFAHAKRPAHVSSSSEIFLPASNLLLLLKYRRYQYFLAGLNQLRRSDPKQLRTLLHVKDRQKSVKPASNPELAAASFYGDQIARWRWRIDCLPQKSPLHDGINLEERTLHISVEGGGEDPEGLVELALTLELQSNQNYLWYLDSAHISDDLKRLIPTRVADRLRVVETAPQVDLRLRAGDLLFPDGLQALAQFLAEGSPSPTFIPRTIVKCSRGGYFTQGHSLDETPALVTSSSNVPSWPIGVRTVSELDNADFVPSRHPPLVLTFVEYLARYIKDRCRKLY